MPRFTLATHDNINPHRFEVFDCAADTDDLVSELSAEVRALYLDAELGQLLEQASADLDPVTDADAMAQLVQSAAQAAIPASGQRPTQPQLDTARNELAEVICYAALEQVHDAVLPAKRVRHKEIPGQMSRGMDALALREEHHSDHGLRIYLAETKASSSDASPPAVVAQGDDSLHAQLHAAVCERSRVVAELARALKYAGEQKALVARALVLWSKQELPTTVVPFLLRPADKHGADDFGCFRVDQSPYAPADVAFCLVRVDGTLEELAQAVYDKARA